jgi:hypothetical protein
MQMLLYPTVAGTGSAMVRRFIGDMPTVDPSSLNASRAVPEGLALPT